MLHPVPELLAGTQMDTPKLRRPSARLSTLGFSVLVLSLVLFALQLWLWSTRHSLDTSPQPSHHQSTDADDLDSIRYHPTQPPESKALPASTWTCTLEGDTSKDARMTRQCVVQHVCVDDQGLFLLSKNTDHGNSPFPEINLMSSLETSHYYWKPRFKPLADIPSWMHYKAETVFVHGLFQPGHFSHYLYDGLLPLYSTMKRFNGTRSSWLLRQAEYLGENTVDQAVWEMEAILPEGRELVLKPFEVVSDFQALPPKDSATTPLCFERAVIGLGLQCGLSYCKRNTPTEVYLQYRDQIQEYYWPTPARWEEFLKQREQEEQGARQSAGRRLKSFETKKTKSFSPTQCLKTARYYGFEQNKGNGWNSSMTPTEPAGRRGIKDPDMVNSRLQTRDRPVVAIIERHGSRAVLNLDHVIQTIVQSNHFRVKVLTYDSGCGIPETAYLMRDVNILISTHGNALGGSLWMPSPLPSSRSQSHDYQSQYHDHPFPAVISIDTTRYRENWFQSTTTAMGQRFILHRCGPKVSYYEQPQDINEDVCPLHRNLDLARAILKRLGITLDKATEHEDLLDLTGPEYPIDLMERYNEGIKEEGFKFNQFVYTYWKALERYADPAQLLKVLEQIRAENIQDAEGLDAGTRKRKSYLDLCIEGRCCGPECEVLMYRNVVGPLRAFGQDMSTAQWGEHLWSDEHNEFMRSGQILRSWTS